MNFGSFTQAIAIVEKILLAERNPTRQLALHAVRRELQMALESERIDFEENQAANGCAGVHELATDDKPY
jgi:hypothetical protein